MFEDSRQNRIKNTQKLELERKYMRLEENYFRLHRSEKLPATIAKLHPPAYL